MSSNSQVLQHLICHQALGQPPRLADFVQVVVFSSPFSESPLPHPRAPAWPVGSLKKGATTVFSKAFRITVKT